MDQINGADVEHRARLQQYVINDPRPWPQEHLGRLDLFGHERNQHYFGGRLETPNLLFAPVARGRWATTPR